jgi:hypothetical protein
MGGFQLPAFVLLFRHYMFLFFIYLKEHHPLKYIKPISAFNYHKN